MRDIEKNCDNCKYLYVPSTEYPCDRCVGDRFVETESEMVDHPAHYNREGAMECIDEMVAIFGVERVMTFCLLNVWKYRYRAADKGGTKDMEKSDDYMRKYLELKKSCTRVDATGAIEVSEARNGGGEV